MKKILLAAILFAGFSLVSCAQEKSSLGLELRVVTSNVRYMTANDGQNSWEYRKDALADALLSLDADIIGTQEAVAAQKAFLEEKLKDYKSVGVGRDDGKEKGEHSAIFYNAKRFKAIDSGNFWLSETPDVPSLGWDAACVRVASWAFLEEKSSGKRFFFVNTHLDHVGVVARHEGVSLLVKKAHEIGAGCPMVITGDFNIYNDSQEIERIKEMGLIHAYDIAAEKKLQKASWHGYSEDIDKHVQDVNKSNGRDIPVPQIIDYIFISQGTCSYYEIMDPRGPQGVFLSDHSPVFADITL
ncbi:MAG: endonuclease/exonuclease/phosphatase family protein [Bacteroidales bacterium]|nr:endonuclease/exonuclease/phosphatase family protein [Bacteroidales bacterium]